MGDYKYSHCMNGNHPLIEGNLTVNKSTGTRECRLCRNAREAKRRRDKRMERKKVLNALDHC